MGCPLPAMDSHKDKSWAVRVVGFTDDDDDSTSDELACTIRLVNDPTPSPSSGGAGDKGPLQPQDTVHRKSARLSLEGGGKDYRKGDIMINDCRRKEFQPGSGFSDVHCRGNLSFLPFFDHMELPQIQALPR